MKKLQIIISSVLIVVMLVFSHFSSLLVFVEKNQSLLLEEVATVIFGVDIFSKNDKPTNAEFVALIADKLSLETR